MKRNLLWALVVWACLLPGPGASADEIMTAPEVDSLAPPPGDPPPEQTSDPLFYLEGQLFNSPDVAITTASNVTQSENSVFIDPRNPQVLLNSNNSSDWPLNTIYGADWFISTDGGKTWTGSVGGVGGTNRGDPATAIDRNGYFYVGYIAANRGQDVAWSADGANWTHVQVANSAPGNSSNLLDKNHLWVDTSVQSPYSGRLYSAWTNLDYTGSAFHIQVSWSPGGANQSWATPETLSTQLGGIQHQGVNLKTGPNGVVYAVWAIYDNSQPDDEDAIGFASSTNGGESWSSPQRIVIGVRGIRLTKLGGSKTMRVNSFPSMCVDNTGKLYVVWTNRGDPSGGAGDPDIFCITSVNQGQTWSSPIRVNQDQVGNGKDQWFPWIAADPMAIALPSPTTIPVIFPPTIGRRRTFPFPVTLGRHGKT